ncbi:primosomal protein DnaI [Bacillus cereus]|nr:primosomal protein DnaI [Bacillus cereus]
MMKILKRAALPLLLLFVFLFENMFATIVPTASFLERQYSSTSFLYHCVMFCYCVL